MIIKKRKNQGGVDVYVFVIFFFFSSRRRHTRCGRDWSSDVCSSDLVIGVPVLGKALGGADALYSTVQMPPGIPVATMAINGAKNAGLLAVEILGVDRKSVV